MTLIGGRHLRPRPAPSQEFVAATPAGQVRDRQAGRNPAADQSTLATLRV